MPMYQAPQDESSDSTHLSSKRQRDKRPQLSYTMHARLGHRSLVSRGRRWLQPGKHTPTPQFHPLFITTSRTKQYDKTERTHQMSHPQVPLAKGWITCSLRFLARILSITTPQGDFSCQNFLRMMGLAIRSTISCITDSS